MSRKSKIQKCKFFSITEDESDKLINEITNPKYKTVLILAFEGLRSGEIAHFKSKWLHVDDKYSKEDEADHIRIPLVSNLCDCTDCCVQSYIEKHREDDNKKYTEEWYKIQQKEFFKLSKDERKTYATYWKPKSDAGTRKVWLMNRERALYLKSFFEIHETVGLKRRSLWPIVKKCGQKVFGKDSKKLFPHACRSSKASILAGHGASSATLMSQIGWSSIKMSDSYVVPESKMALLDLKKIKEK